MNMKW